MNTDTDNTQPVSSLSDYKGDTIDTYAQDVADLKAKTLFDMATEGGGTVPRLVQKYADSALTFDQKMEVLKKRTLQKQANLEGYQEVSLTSMPDADSGDFTDANGNSVSFRLTSGSSNFYDAIDSKKVLDQNTSFSKSTTSRAAQYAAVAEMSGKNVNELIDEDFDNIKRYQSQQRLGSITNPNYTFEKYDPSIKYEEAAIIPPNTKILVKSLGKDVNGRLLIDAINPNTGRRTGFDASNNPYLNSRFNLYKSLDTEKNVNDLVEFEESHDSIVKKYNELRSRYDDDSRLGESLDMAQAALYQMGARVLQRLPGPSKEYWDKMADAESGFADLLAGVRPDSRKEYQREAAKVGEFIEQGEYGKATLQAFTQLDRFLADSAPQMGLLAAGTLASGGLLTAAGVTGAGATVLGARAILGAIPAGIDKALSNANAFKEDNGRDMTNAEFARNLAFTTATLVPESIMLAIFGKAVSGIFSKAVTVLV